MKQLILFLICSLLFSCSNLLHKQGSKAYTPSVTHNPDYRHLNPLQQDFLYLTSLCEEGFPLIDQYFPRDKRKAMEAEALQKLEKEPDNHQLFSVLSRQYLAQFRNQHTTIYTNTRFTGLFPFTVYSEAKHWRIQNISTTYDSSYIGQAIVAINGHPVQDFASKLRNFVFAENETSSRKAIASQQLFSRSKFLQIADLIPQPDSLLLELANGSRFWIKEVSDEQKLTYYPQEVKRHPITRRRDRHFDYQLLPQQNTAYLQLNRFNDRDDMLDMLDSYVKPYLQPLARTYLKWQFSKEEPVPAVRAFYDPQRPSLKAYLNEMMDAIDSLGIENLIIDLRHNPGGSLTLGKQLMYYLTDRTDLRDYHRYLYTSELSKLFNTREYHAFWVDYEASHQQEPEKNQLYPLYKRDSTGNSFFRAITTPASPYYISPDRKVFKGRVFVLANWSTSSAAALLTTLLQDNGLATVIGTPVANNPTGPTAYTPYVLPNTEARGSIASTYRSRPQQEKPAVQQPDYLVELSLKDYLQGHDLCWEKALDLIAGEH